MPEQSHEHSARTWARTFSFRAVIIGSAATLFMAIWIHFHEVLGMNPRILAENSPPAAAVGLLMGVVLVAGMIAWLKPKLRLTPAELIIIYTILVTAAPLMSQGMWHRFLGFVVAIPHNRHNMVLVDSFSDKLWPHGPQLIQDPRFTETDPETWQVEPQVNTRRVEVSATPVGATTAIELVNPEPDHVADADPDDLRTTLRIPIPRHRNNREILVPLERYYFNFLVRLSDLRSQSRLIVELVTAMDETVPILTMHRNTEPNFTNLGGFMRAGEPYVNLPQNTGEYAELVFILEGAGRATITDIKFFSNEAIARLHKGTTEVAASDLDRVPENERNSMLVRPDNLRSPAGIWYVMKGYIPYRQWLVPLAYWTSIVGAIFLCLLGIGVIFRRQWADKERFAFPMVVIPRLLIDEERTDGRLIRPLYRKRTFYIGAAIALLYTIWLGLAHYVPGLPNPRVDVALAEYFRTPASRAYFSGVNFQIYIMFAAVAFFVDLDMLRSILIFFALARIPHYLGEVFGWKQMHGPAGNFPFWHEQHIGAFLGLALIVLWISRRHLVEVGKTILAHKDGINDSGEATSYRTAALMIVGSFIFFGVWGEMTGLGAGSALLFFGFLVVCGLSASRIRTEMGAPMTYFTPYYPYLIFFLLGGLTVFGTETMVLAYCAGGFMAVAQFLLFAPTQVEMMHFGNQYNANPKGIGKALILGLLGGVLLGGYVMLVWAYGVGGENIEYMRTWAIRQDWYLGSLRSAVNEVNSAAVAAAAEGTDIATEYPAGPLTAVAVGTGVTVLLTALRARFVGFWLHPIGYVLANTHFILMCWGSLLVAWVIKAATLKIGGPRAVRHVMAPVMAGLFCGGIVGILFWNVVAITLMSRGVVDVFMAFP